MQSVPTGPFQTVSMLECAGCAVAFLCFVFFYCRCSEQFADIFHAAHARLEPFRIDGHRFAPLAMVIPTSPTMWVMFAILARIVLLRQYFGTRV